VSLVIRQTPEQAQTAIAHHLNIPHQMRIGDGDKSLGAEKAPHLQLEAQCLTHCLALGAIQHGLFKLGELHANSR